MKIEIHDGAEKDIIEGFKFYEQQIEGLGNYFLDSIFSDIESLQIYAILDFRRNPTWIRERLA